MKQIILLSFVMIAFFIQLKAQEKLKSNGVIPVMSWGGISQSEISVENYKKLNDVGVNIDIALFSNADAIANALDAAGKAGVKLMISCPELKSEPEKTFDLKFYFGPNKFQLLKDQNVGLEKIIPLGWEWPLPYKSPFQPGSKKRL